MLLFLKIVLAVVVVLLATVVIGWMLFKRWLKRRVGGYQVAGSIVGGDYAAPARIQLQVADDVEPEADFLNLWNRVRALGFAPLGDLEDHSGAYSLLRFAVHAEQPIAAAISQSDDAAHFTLFALTASNRLYAVGSGPGQSLVAGSLHWQVEAGIGAATALEQLRGLLGEQPLRNVDLRMLKAAFEAAYSTRMDARLARPPARADIEALARLRQPAASPADIDAALGFARAHWQSQLQVAVLDRYRRASKVDAVTWERIEGDVQVVHAHLGATELGHLLPLDEAGEQFAAEQEAAGITGIELYEKLLERLPAAQRRRRLGEVERPLRAVLYVREAESAPVAARPERPHLYAGVDADGREVQGTLLASGSADAKQRLAEMGLNETRLLTEPIANDEKDNVPLDPQLAAIAARAVQESVWISMLRALWSNAWIWAPPAVLLALTLREGAPFSGGDYGVFAYATLALLAVALLIAPMFLYNQLLLARTQGRWTRARACLWLLRRLNVLGAPTAWQLTSEECKILAGRGDAAAALALWAPFEASLSPEQYLTGLVSIHDASGAHDQMIAAQRAALNAADAKELVSIDLAMALARYRRAVDEPEDLLARVSPDGLSELALSGYHFTRGLINAERGLHELAVRQFEQAVARAATFKGNPLVQGMITELHGFIAWALKSAGHAERAESMWRVVGPVLESRSGARDIVARYRAA